MQKRNSMDGELYLKSDYYTVCDDPLFITSIGSTD